MTKEDIYSFRTNQLLDELEKIGFKMPDWEYPDRDYQRWECNRDFGEGMNLTIEKYTCSDNLNRSGIRNDLLELLVEEATVLNAEYSGTFRFFDNYVTYKIERNYGTIPKPLQKYSEREHYKISDVITELVELVKTESEKKNNKKCKMEMKLDDQV